MPKYLITMKLISQKQSFRAMNNNDFIYDYRMLNNRLILALYMQIADSTEMSQLGERDIWHRVRRVEPSHLLQNISLFPFDSNCSAQILFIRTALMYDAIGLLMIGFGMISAVRLTRKHLAINKSIINDREIE